MASLVPISSPILYGSYEVDRFKDTLDRCMAWLFLYVLAAAGAPHGHYGTSLVLSCGMSSVESCRRQAREPWREDGIVFDAICIPGTMISRDPSVRLFCSGTSVPQSVS